MNKIYKASLLLLCLSLFHVPYSHAQVNKKENKEVNKEDADNDEELIKDETEAERENHKHDPNRQKINFGIEAGVNMANYRFSYPNDPSKYSAKAGGRFGAQLDFPLSAQLYFQPGVFYVMNGGISKGFDGTMNNTNTLTVNTIEVPFNIIFKFRRPGTSRFFFGAGPYAGYNLSVSETNTDHTYQSNPDITIGTKVTDYIKPFDFGLGATAGYELANGLLIALRIQQSIANLSPELLMETRLVSYGASVGYFFGKKPRHKHAKGSEDNYLERKM